MVGAINNPVDWFYGLSSIFRGIGKLWQPERDLSGIHDLVEGVLTILREDTAN
jgi:hypothetical protein